MQIGWHLLTITSTTTEAACKQRHLMDIVFGPFEQPSWANSTASTAKESSQKPRDPSEAIMVVSIVMVGIFVAALAGAAYFTCQKRAKKRSKLKKSNAAAPASEDA